MHIFGFTSLADFANSAFGLKSVAFNTSVGVLAAIGSFFSSYIYDSAGAVWLLVLLFVGDLITGIVKSYMKRLRENPKEGFGMNLIKSIKSNKLFRSFVIIILHLMVLGLSWNMAFYYPAFFFLPGLVYGGMIGTQFVSIIENLFEAGIIKSKLYYIIKEKFSLKKLFKRKDDASNNEE